MVTELATQFVSHPTTQVYIRNGSNVESNNDEFQGIRHTSGREQAAPASPQRPRMDKQHLKSQFTDRKHERLDDKRLHGHWQLFSHIL